MSTQTAFALAAAALLALAGCREEAAAPPEPVKMSADAVGHFCQMNMLEHPGPKAQVHLDGLPGSPLFFAQVRDAIAYRRMPEQSHAITATYVSDMSHAPSWENPGRENWMIAAQAHYVIGSQRVGGMGAPELVPFSDRADASAFAARHGGRVVRLADIPDAVVLAPVAEGDATTPAQNGTSAKDDNAGYAERLRALSREKE